MNNKEEILRQYDNKHKLFKQLGELVMEEMSHKLNGRIKTLPITYRLKDRSSLENKMDKKAAETKDGNKMYKSLDDITDIAGVRIITYHESDIIKVAKIVKDAFVVDKANSPDKRNKDNTNFGYKSMHFVVSLKPGNNLGEGIVRLQDLKAEVQVRTILQHAWAEIEHDLGYKSEITIPIKYRRMFSRLSALLEMGDMEFDRLKKGVSSYKDELPSKIANKNKAVLIDQDSLTEFINVNDTFNYLKEYMEKAYNFRFVISRPDSEIIERLIFLGIKNINKLDSELSLNKDHFIRFVELFLVKRNQRGLHLRDTSPLYYFVHYLASAKGKDFFSTYRKFGNEKGYKIVSRLAFDEIFKETAGTT